MCVWAHQHSVSLTLCSLKLQALFQEALVPLVACLHGDELGPAGALHSFWLAAQAQVMGQQPHGGGQQAQGGKDLPAEKAGAKGSGVKTDWQALIAGLQRLRVAYPSVPLGALLTL